MSLVKFYNFKDSLFFMQAAAFADGGVLATFSLVGALIALRILYGLFSVFSFKIKKLTLLSEL